MTIEQRDLLKQRLAEADDPEHYLDLYSLARAEDMTPEEAIAAADELTREGLNDDEQPVPEQTEEDKVQARILDAIALHDYLESLDDDDTTDNNFNPDQHPRGPDGKFGEGSGESSSKRVSVDGELVQVEINPSHDDLRTMLSHPGMLSDGNTKPGKQLKGVATTDGKLYAWDAIGESGEDVHHTDVYHKLGHSGNLPFSQRFEIRITDGKVTFDTHSGGESSPHIIGVAKRLGVTVNQFCATGAGGGVDASCGKGTSETTGGSGEAGAKPGLLGRAIAKLPMPVQKVLTAVKTVAFAGYIAGNKAVQAVARERGLSDEKIASLSTRVAWADAAMGGTRAAGVMAAIGLPMLAAPASMMPWGSLGYLAGSTLANPKATWRATKDGIRTGLATLRAAKDGIAAMRSKHADKLTGNMVLNTQARVALIAEALESHDYDDWYQALLSAAFDQVNSLEDAIGLANTFYAEHPVDDSEPQDDDADEVFGDVQDDEEAE